MRTEEIEIYKFSELSDDAKERARNWWRECENQDFDTYWMVEHFVAAAECLGITFDQRKVRLMNGEHRNEPEISWSGFCSQGDGASFEGDWSFTGDAMQKIAAHAPQDDELRRIAMELDSIVYSRVHHRTYKYRCPECGHVCERDVCDGDDETDETCSGIVYIDMEGMSAPSSQICRAELGEPIDFVNTWQSNESDLVATITKNDSSYCHEMTMDIVVSDSDGEIDTDEHQSLHDTIEEAMRDFARWIYRQLEQQYEYTMSDESVDENIIANEYEFTESGDIY